MTNWLEDERGKTIQVNGTSYPDRKNLTITAPGALTTDSEAGQATVLDFSALTVGGAVGPADAVQYTDGAGALLGDSGLTYDGANLALSGSFFPGGIIAMGTTPAGTGDFRVEEDWSLYARNNGNTGNLPVFNIVVIDATSSRVEVGSSNMDVNIRGALTQGGTPSTSGYYRTEAAWNMYARNQGNTADIHILGTNGANATKTDILLGSGNVNEIEISSATLNLPNVAIEHGTVSPVSTIGKYRVPFSWSLWARNQGNSGNLEAIDIVNTSSTTSVLGLGSANMHVRQKGPTAYDEKTASFTVALGEEGTDLYCNSGSAIVITLTDDATQAIPINSRVFFYHEGAGALTVVAGGTATIVGGSKTSDGQTSAFVAWKVGADTWKVTGEVS